MSVDPNAEIEITAFRWVPPFAEGLVRDLRLRWALEEIDRPYRVRLLDATKPRPAEYCREQPWGQVPSFRDNDVQLFESGAILIHLGLQDERLLPTDKAGRARGIAWVIAALNSVETTILPMILIDTFSRIVRKEVHARDQPVGLEHQIVPCGWRDRSGIIREAERPGMFSERLEVARDQTVLC